MPLKSSLRRRSHHHSRPQATPTFYGFIPAGAGAEPSSAQLRSGTARIATIRLQNSLYQPIQRERDQRAHADSISQPNQETSGFDHIAFVYGFFSPVHAATLLT